MTSIQDGDRRREPEDTRTFVAAWGRGSITPENEDRVRVRCDLATFDDPRTLAGFAIAAPAGLRLGIRDRIAVAEARCRLDEVARLLAWIAAPDLGGTPPAIDLAVGTIAIALPPLARPTFVRVAPPAAAPDARADAQATYLLIANRRLAAGLRCGWLDGAGITVDPAAADPAVVTTTVRELVDGIRALGDPLIAASFLEYCGLGRSSGSVTDHPPKGEPS